MRLIDIKELGKVDFDLRKCDIRSQGYWKSGSVWDMLKRPRPVQAILYALGCEIEYTLPQGRSFRLERGRCIYLPQGSLYRADFCQVTGRITTLLINFSLELDGEELNLAEEPTVLPHACSEIAETLYRRRLSESFSELEAKALLLLLLSRWQGDTELSAGNRCSVRAIEPAIDIIDKSETCMPTVAVLAEACHISEGAFRKKFRESFGVSPKEYCLELRIERAKRLMSECGFSVNEASEAMGFSSPAYFSRIFKKKTGRSPKKYVSAKRAESIERF